MIGTRYIVYNSLLPYQCLTIYNVLFLFIIVMASSSTSSPSEDHTSRTDLSNIPTEEER